VYPMSAEEFFDQWYAWGVRRRLRPVIKLAKMLKRHLPSLLSYLPPRHHQRHERGPATRRLP